MDYKDRPKKETVWAKFCEENNLDKDGSRANAHSSEKSLT